MNERQHLDDDLMVDDMAPNDACQGCGGVIDQEQADYCSVCSTAMYEDEVEAYLSAGIYVEGEGRRHLPLPTMG